MFEQFGSWLGVNSVIPVNSGAGGGANAAITMTCVARIDLRKLF